MRMRLGLVVGFGAGYYLGAKAGHERYDDINRFVDKVKRSEAYETATHKAKAAVDLGVERARDLGGRGGTGDDVSDDGLTTTPTVVTTNGTSAEVAPLIPGGEG
ncbi:MAG: hypothetical protein M3503_07905 [Actinomycetota bacterium]|nr:hypothetical protein [Actinomycetota bacterium]